MFTGHLLPDLTRSLFSNHLLADPGAGIATRSIRCPRRACRRSRRAIETSTRMPPAERGREVRLDRRQREVDDRAFDERADGAEDSSRSAEYTYDIPSLMRRSYAVFC